jgi:hypothetical protein
VPRELDLALVNLDMGSLHANRLAEAARR